MDDKNNYILQQTFNTMENNHQQFREYVRKENMNEISFRPTRIRPVNHSKYQLEPQKLLFSDKIKALFALGLGLLLAGIGVVVIAGL